VMEPNSRLEFLSKTKNGTRLPEQGKFPLPRKRDERSECKPARSVSAIARNLKHGAAING
jgi:hypothetical protein